MNKPKPTEVSASLAIIASGAGVKKKDFATICLEYLHGKSRPQLIGKLMASNKYLAETVILFNNHLLEKNDSPEEVKPIIDQMYRHYVINTQGPIPVYAEELATSDADDRFDLFSEATEYAKILSVGVSKGSNKSSLLSFNGEEIPCPAWGEKKKEKKKPNPVWVEEKEPSPAYSLREVGPVINQVRYGRSDVIPSFLFGLDENAQTPSLENAMTLADFSQLAYTNSDYIKKQLTEPQWGYESFRWFEDEASDTQAFIAVKKKDRYVVVCFRGTAGLQDWITDIKLFKTDSSDGKGRVHRGFKSALDGVWDRIASALNTFDKDMKVFFTGHSLGAALAQLAAYRRAITDPDQVAGVYVYGSPRVGNRDYKAAYDALLKDRTFLHINNTDIVPQVPPRFLGYRHLGDAPNRFDIGHGLSNPVEPMPESIEEVESIDQLPPELQAAVRADLQAAQGSVEATTAFLKTRPEDVQEVFYSTTFDTGKVDDHGVEQYLFKFGCAIVDGEFQRIKDEFSARS